MAGDEPVSLEPLAYPEPSRRPGPFCGLLQIWSQARYRKSR